MKKLLVKKEGICVYHFVDGKLVEGTHPDLRGDVTGLRGNVTGLRGNVTGLSGDVTGLSGDVDDCCISDAERAEGVDVSDLTAESIGASHSE